MPGFALPDAYGRRRGKQTRGLEIERRWRVSGSPPPFTHCLCGHLRSMQLPGDSRYFSVYRAPTDVSIKVVHLRIEGPYLTQYASPYIRPYAPLRKLAVLLLRLSPNKETPSSLAATPVVPDPQNGSNTNSPSLVEATSARLTSLKGFWVGW